MFLLFIHYLSYLNFFVEANKFQVYMFTLYVISQYYFFESIYFWCKFPLPWIRQSVSITSLSFLQFRASLSKIVGFQFVFQLLLIRKISIMIANGHLLTRDEILKVQAFRSLLAKCMYNKVHNSPSLLAYHRRISDRSNVGHTEKNILSYI